MGKIEERSDRRIEDFRLPRRPDYGIATFQQISDKEVLMLVNGVSTRLDEKQMRIHRDYFNKILGD